MTASMAEHSNGSDCKEEESHAAKESTGVRKSEQCILLTQRRLQTAEIRSSIVLTNAKGLFISTLQAYLTRSFSL